MCSTRFEGGPLDKVCSDGCRRKKAVVQALAFKAKHPKAMYKSSAPYWKDVIYNELGRKCAKCGTTEKLELDHIIPEAIGRENRLANIQVLCESCHKQKNREMPSWKLHQMAVSMGLNNDEKNYVYRKGHLYRINL